ncbi:MAG: DUF6431 domain-containing protein [Solirubrobacteraceae bacterium]
MTAREYAAAGRELDVPRPDCPGCRAQMIFHGSYARPLRLGEEIVRLVVRRARCRSCRVTHALTPDFVALQRLDGIEAIGGAIEQMAGGVVAAAIAKATAVPYTTVRDWRRRFADRAELLTKGFLAASVAF